jgi:hypothetical protein
LVFRSKAWESSAFCTLITSALCIRFTALTISHITPTFLALLSRCNGCPENISIHSVVIPELKFRDVQRHILFANLVERADDAAFEDAPETLNRLGVNGTHNVLALVVVDGRVLWKILIQVLVANPLIGAEQANLVKLRLNSEGTVHSQPLTPFR